MRKNGGKTAISTLIVTSENFNIEGCLSFFREVAVSPTRHLFMPYFPFLANGSILLTTAAFREEVYADLNPKTKTAKCSVCSACINFSSGSWYDREECFVKRSILIL